MINIRNWSSNIIENSKRVAIPIMTHPGIEMCNYKVVDAVKDGNVHFKAIKKLCDLYPSSAATVIMDLTVEAEAFGAEVIFPEDEVPSVIKKLVENDIKIYAVNENKISLEDAFLKKTGGNVID